MKKDTAKRIAELMLSHSAELDEVIKVVMNESSDSLEVEKFKSNVGQLMATMYFEFLEPIYQQYPDICPKNMKFSILKK